MYKNNFGDLRKAHLRSNFIQNISIINIDGKMEQCYNLIELNSFGGTIDFKVKDTK